ncbi:hypothetical protein EAH_00067610, partial [Eimeria acervulina]
VVGRHPIICACLDEIQIEECGCRCTPQSDDSVINARDSYNWSCASYQSSAEGAAIRRDRPGFLAKVQVIAWSAVTECCMVEGKQRRSRKNRRCVTYGGEPGMRCGVCFLHNEADEQLWSADQWIQRYLAYSAQQGYGSLRNGAM